MFPNCLHDALYSFTRPFTCQKRIVIQSSRRLTIATVKSSRSRIIVCALPACGFFSDAETVFHHSVCYCSFSNQNKFRQIGCKHVDLTKKRTILLGILFIKQFANPTFQNINSGSQPIGFRIAGNKFSQKNRQ
jgi:hypothetical protein